LPIISPDAAGDAMSNPLAIAGVTAVIRDLLADGLIDADLDALGGIVVSSLPLEQILNAQPPQQQNRLNVLFTHATPNTGWTNSRLPTRDGNGALVARPLLALDLHYLVTAIGAQDFAAEALLGYAMHLLHEQPVLGAAAIRRSLGQGAVNGAALPPLFQNLAAAELADQIESIRITPENPDSERWSHIWSSMNVGLRASVVYTASVVLIEGTAAPRSPLPVIEGRLAVRTIRRPGIARVFVQPAAGRPGDTMAPMFPGSLLVLRGSGLLAEQETRVAIGGREVVPSAASSPTELVAAIPADASAGVGTIQVRHYAVGPGGAADLRLREQSNAIAIGVRPLIAADAVNDPGVALTDSDADNGLISGTVTVRLAHPVRIGQRASLRLSGRGAASHDSFAFFAAPLAANADRLVFDITGVPQGPYLVRVEIDGAESVPASDANGFTGPMLQVAP
jgi:hypothetical protein